MRTLFNVENVEKNNHFPVESRFYCILTSPNLFFLILNHQLNTTFIGRFEAILNILLCVKSVCLLKLYKMGIFTQIPLMELYRFGKKFQAVFCV